MQHISGEPSKVVYVCRVMNMTELAYVLEVCTASKRSFRNMSERKIVIEIYALSQFTAVNELLG